MITRFAIENFKSLAKVPADDEALELSALNVLIGPNGCGKSSLLQAIDFLRAFFMSSVEVYLRDRGWSYDDLPNLRQTRKSIRWEIEAEVPPDEQHEAAALYRYCVVLQPRRYLGVDQERLTVTGPDGEERVLLQRNGRDYSILNESADETEQMSALRLPASVMSQIDASRHRKRYASMLRFRAWVEGFRSFLIWDPKVLRGADRGAHSELGASGEHLASVIGHLHDKYPKAFERLIQRVQRLFPTVSNISVSGRGWGWRGLRLHEANGREIVFNSTQMSDGVLRLLAVTTLLYSPWLPNVITFEEPENGVHPALVREVVQILREVTQRKKPHPCQVIVTTHSPYLLDEFYDHPEEVYCLDRSGPQAGTTISRLSTLKQLTAVREKLSLGEAWTMGLLCPRSGKRR